MGGYPPARSKPRANARPSGLFGSARCSTEALFHEPSGDNINLCILSPLSPETITGYSVTGFSIFTGVIPDFTRAS